MNFKSELKEKIFKNAHSWIHIKSGECFPKSKSAQAVPRFV